VSIATVPQTAVLIVVEFAFKLLSIINVLNLWWFLWK